MSAPTLQDRTTNARSRALAVLATTLAASATWLVVVPLLDTELTVERWDSDATMTVDFANVVITALIAALAGWAALATLERLTAHAKATWTIGAAAVLVISLGMPATATTTTSAAVVLVVLHLVVGATLIPMLARSAR